VDRRLALKAPFRPDTRSEAFFKRFHRRSRKRNPRLQALFAVLLVPLLGVLARIRVSGREYLPAGAYIASANHPSQLDPFFVALALRRRVHFMGKSDLFAGAPGWLYSRLGAFPVRRGIWDTEAFDTAETVLARGKVMAVFPEGGLSDPADPVNGYRDARPGAGYLAQRTGAPVVPIHLHGTRKLYKPWTWPKVRITIGEPTAFERNDTPSRESNQVIADAIFERVKALAPD
jgi:1-acyl-sn-glycerol-3-phosphate acyltransferase